MLLTSNEINRYDEIHNYKIIFNYWSIKRKKTTNNKDVRKVTLQIYSDLPETYQQYTDIASGKPDTNWIKTIKKFKCLWLNIEKYGTSNKRQL